MKIKKTGYDILVNVICLGLLVGVFIFLGMKWDSIPEKIPGHYNHLGDVDRWGNKGELLVLPVISWIMYIGISIIEIYPSIWNTGVQVTEQNKEKVYRILKNMIGTEKLLLVIVFSYMTINSSLSDSLPIWFLPVFLMLMFGSILYFIIKLMKIK